MGRLDNKVALITGAARGIGKAVALSFAEEGAILVLADKDIETLSRTEAEIKKKGSRVKAIPTDVSIESQIENLFSAIIKHFGRLDILVNNAGIFDYGPIENMTTDTWNKVLAVNLTAPFICIQQAFRIMKLQGGGRIINIGSISAQRVRPYNAAYSSTKFGLVGLTHTAALEGRKYGISCGCLHPGNTRHDYHAVASGDWEREPMMSPEEVAAAVVYMACQPPHVNVLELVQLPTEQLFLGRG
jgi:NAD(P)-dependent dehydrogenase (short-subunit alcohol dehydrogenase family)